MEEKTILGVKTLFVPAKVRNIDIVPVLKKIKLNGKKIGLVSSVQYVDYLSQVKKYLENQGNEVIIGGQMVGCNASAAIKIKEDLDCLIFFGSGEFHPIELLEVTNVRDIYLVNPSSQTISKFTEEEIIILERKKQGRIKKYLMAERIGILVSIKPGQQALSSAIKLAKKCGKEAYIFIADEIDVNRLEDFNDIQIWVNTSCPRLEGKNIISLKEILGNQLVDYHSY